MKKLLCIFGLLIVSVTAYGQQSPISNTTTSSSVATATSTAPSFTQTAHGFVTGDAVRRSGSAWVKSLADTTANAEVYGIVVVIDANTFRIVASGLIQGLSSANVEGGGAVVADTSYYLSATEAGKITAVSPTISKPILSTITASDAMVINLRGMQAGSVGGTQTITSGTATTINANVARVYVNPATVMASHTITLPAASDGAVIAIYFGGAITVHNPVVTTLSIAPNAGQTITQTITLVTANAGDAIRYVYDGALTTWRREL